MQRKSAFLWAGFLTAAVTTAALSFTGFAAAGAAPASESTAVITEKVVDATVDTAYLQQVETTLSERERTLQDQLAQSKQAVVALDAKAQPQIEAMQAQLAEMETDAAGRVQNTHELQQQIAGVQGGIDQDGQVYQQNLAKLQAYDAQLRQELAATVAELQSAYGELASRQAAEASSINNDSNNGGNNGGGGDHEDDDHGHEEHEDEGHDD